MIKAKVKTSDGRHLLIIGLSEGNIARLKNCQPIFFSTEVMDIPDNETIGGVTIFYGATEDECFQIIRESIGEDTEIKTAVKGPRTIQ